VNNPSLPDPIVLTKLLEIVLIMNTFEFKNACYRQLQGCAMGTIFAPSYANIFMGKLEKEFLSQATLKPLYYKHYIDDLIVLWEHREDELKTFISNLNCKFTYEHSHHSINYLDLQIYKGPNFLCTGKLDVSTYLKPMNKQIYIHATSFHPKRTSKGVEKWNDLSELTQGWILFYSLEKNVKANLLKRGYSHKFIDQQLKKVKFSNQS